MCLTNVRVSTVHASQAQMTACSKQIPTKAHEFPPFYPPSRGILIPVWEESGPSLAETSFHSGTHNTESHQRLPVLEASTIDFIDWMAAGSESTSRETHSEMRPRHR